MKGQEYTRPDQKKALEDFIASGPTEPSVQYVGETVASLISKLPTEEMQLQALEIAKQLLTKI